MNNEFQAWLEVQGYYRKRYDGTWMKDGNVVSGNFLSLKLNEFKESNGLKKVDHTNKIEKGGVELIEKTIASKNATRYLKEMFKFNGGISRGSINHDYLTAPKEESNFYQGKEECVEKKLITRLDAGNSCEFIRWGISDRGLTVLSLTNNLKNNDQRKDKAIK